MGYPVLVTPADEAVVEVRRLAFELACLELGVLPFRRSDGPAAGRLSGLSPDEARRAKRRWRKLWRRALRRRLEQEAEEDASPITVWLDVDPLATALRTLAEHGVGSGHPRKEHRRRRQATAADAAWSEALARAMRRASKTLGFVMERGDPRWRDVPSSDDWL